MSISEDFTADEMAFISSRGEDTEALDRAYGSGGAKKADDDEGEMPRHPGMDQEEKPNGSQKATGKPQKAEAEEPEDDDDEDEDGSSGSKLVPHGRFHKERTRRQAAESESAELKLKFAKAEERLAILNELLTNGGARQPTEAGKQPNGADQQEAKSAWDEPDIDPEEDFAGAMAQLRRRQVEDREARTNWQKQTESRTQESEQSQAYVRDAVAYAKQNPAFAHAYRHLMQTYHRELEAFGMTDANQRNQHIRSEEKKLAKFALENGQSPAQVIMSLAQARGFQLPKPSGEPEDTEKNDTPSLAEAAKEVKGKVENIKKAAKSSASLSNAGGSAKNGLTMESILAMDDDEFFEKVHKLPASKRAKLFAGS